ncbi:MAG: M50 family metallopeptidase [Armatimonadota bacterium]
MEALAPVFSVASTIFQFLLVITVIVAVHELGHYLAARMSGMHVEAFAVMMGGVRRTDLSEHEPKGLISARVIWIIAGLGLLTMIVGTVAKNALVFEAGLVASGVWAPLMASLRLERLYHLPGGTAFRRIMITLAVLVAMLFMGTQFRNLDAGTWIGLIAGGMVIAMLVMYYSPLMGGNHANEEERQGEGKITVNGETVPVRFRPLWWVTDKNGTEFSLLLLPLGGFARIRGMQSFEDGRETKIEGGFYTKHPILRLFTLFAGPLFSVLFGIIVLTGVWAANGRQDVSEKPVVGSLSVGGAADKAGIKIGDRITSIDGTAITSFDGIRPVIDAGGEKPRQVTVDREGKALTFTLTPQIQEGMPKLDQEGNPILGERETRLIIGVGPDFETKTMSVGEAWNEAWNQPVVLVKGLATLVSRPQAAKDTMGGPVSVAQATQGATSMGAYGILTLMGMLSLSLGIMNLLPIPPLDGGQMVINFIELIRGGKRLSMNLQQLVTNMGVVLMILLMVSATTIDLGRVTGNSADAKLPEIKTQHDPAPTQP